MGWLPVLLVYLLILATLPLGGALGMSLKRIGTTEVLDRVPLPAAGRSVDVDGGVVAVLLEDDRLVLHDGSKLHSTPWRCEDAVVEAEQIVCAQGDDGLLVLDAQGGELYRVPVDVPVRTVARRGDQLLAGSDDALLTFGRQEDGAGGFAVRGRLDGIGSVVSLCQQPGAALALTAGGDLVGLSLDAELLPRELGRFSVGSAASDLVCFGPEALVAAHDNGVLQVDISDLADMQVRRRFAVGDARAVHQSDGFLRWVVTEDGGAQAMIATMLGPIWVRAPRGIEAQAHAVGGRPPQQMVLVGDELLNIEPMPGRDRLIYGVGLLGALGAALVVGPLLWRREEGLGARLVGLVVAAVGLVFLLQGRTDNPIEALHILEYGALAALIVRAMRPAGGGLAAGVFAALAVALAGLGDETVQFYLPTRSGDLADVWIDARAGVLGAIVGVAAWPAALSLRWSRVWALAAVLIGSLAAYQHVVVGYGYHLQAGEVQFTSRLTRAELDALDRERGAEHARILENTAATGYGTFLAEYPARRAPFLYELRVHLYRRDRRLEKGDVEVACGEQALLEQVFANSFRGTSWEWGPREKARCAPYEGQAYVSPVSEEVMTDGGPVRLIGGALLAVAFFLGMAVRFRRREEGL